MTNISRHKLQDRVNDKLYILLFEVVTSNRTKSDFNKVMIDLLSPVERIMISKRIVIVYLLLQNIDCRMICRVLKVSGATVAKFRLLMEKSEGLVPRLKGIVQNERVQLFLMELVSELRPPGSYGVSWSNAWSIKNRIERKKQTGI